MKGQIFKQNLSHQHLSFVNFGVIKIIWVGSKWFVQKISCGNFFVFRDISWYIIFSIRKMYKQLWWVREKNTLFKLLDFKCFKVNFFILFSFLPNWNWKQYKEKCFLNKRWTSLKFFDASLNKVVLQNHYHLINFFIAFKCNSFTTYFNEILLIKYNAEISGLLTLKMFNGGLFNMHENEDELVFIIKYSRNLIYFHKLNNLLINLNMFLYQYLQTLITYLINVKIFSMLLTV